MIKSFDLKSDFDYKAIHIYRFIILIFALNHRLFLIILNNFFLINKHKFIINL